MLINYDILLLVVSTIAASASLFIAFGLMDRLSRAAQKVNRLSLVAMAIALGIGVLANHLIILLSANIGAPTELSWALLNACLFATGIAISFVYLTILPNPNRVNILLGGCISGLCDLGLFYTSHIAINGADNVFMNPLTTAVATVVSMAIITMSLSLFQWIKNYTGSNRNIAKISAAILIAVGILCIHFVFNMAFSDHASSAFSSAHNVTSSNFKITAIAIALGMVCLILIAFVLVLLYEKQGKKLFSFSLFSSNTNLAQAEQFSLEDSLTKLPNRRAFESHLQSAKKRAIRNGKSFALAYIDLDYFKPINDNYGHHVGDGVLKITAERLNRAVRGCDFVARIGGDEFVAVIEEIENEEDVVPIAERIVTSIKEAYFIDHLTVELSCSLGIAIYPKNGDVDKLLVCADAAMYKAKDQGKNQFRFYDTEIENANDLMLNMQSDLCLAVENREFSLTYLPKIACNTLTAIGAEALIRWQHPTKGEILPNDFLPAAEHFGLIQEINSWVIDECCDMLAEAKENGLELNVSINLSSQQFQDPGLVKKITQKLEDYQLSPSCISFEIKETIAINNQKQFKLLLDKFKSAGIRVILDDFGLLPMSLTYLLDLNIDEVKIDKSFIATVNNDKGSHALVDAIFKLTHALGFEATAEGIETEAQQETIIDLGCDYMQGYLFSKPIKKAALFDLYRKLQFKQLQIDFNNPLPKIKKP
ncbi:MAG: EAL domain-containing protein [Methylophilaceae bacterium]